jgi:hypothetical protein
LSSLSPSCRFRERLFIGTQFNNLDTAVDSTEAASCALFSADCIAVAVSRSLLRISELFCGFRSCIVLRRLPCCSCVTMTQTYSHTSPTSRCLGACVCVRCTPRICAQALHDIYAYGDVCMYYVYVCMYACWGVFTSVSMFAQVVRTGTCVRAWYNFSTSINQTFSRSTGVCHGWQMKMKSPVSKNAHCASRTSARQHIYMVLWYSVHAHRDTQT